MLDLGWVGCLFVCCLETVEGVDWLDGRYQLREGGMKMIMLLPATGTCFTINQSYVEMGEQTDSWV